MRVVPGAGGAAEVAVGGVDDGYGVSFGEDEPIGVGIPGIGGVVAHEAIHQGDGEVEEGQAAGGVSAAGDGAHFDGLFTEFDNLAVEILIISHNSAGLRFYGFRRQQGLKPILQLRFCGFRSAFEYAPKGIG